MLGFLWRRKPAAPITPTQAAIRQQHGFFYQHFLVKQQEYGLLFKEGDFVRFLPPGEYRFWTLRPRYQVEVFNRSQGTAFVHSLLDFFLMKYPQQMQELLTQVETNAEQVALIYQNNRLTAILPPEAREFYWRGFIETRAELIPLKELCQIPPELLKPLLHSQLSSVKQKVTAYIYQMEVPQYFVGLLFIDGQQRAVLSPGVYAYWKLTHNVQISLWDTRQQELEVTGQEILTRDKVSIRVNLVAAYQLTDIAKVLSLLPKPQEFIYRELQLGLRAAIGTRALDALLEDKTIINELVMSYIQSKIEGLGIAVQSVGVRDIILPGDMKMLLNQVVQAEKAAQANIIRRREETAATRSLLNTAKVMEENPTALRLKELETLENVAHQIDTISIYGGLDGLLKELVKLRL